MAFGFFFRFWVRSCSYLGCFLCVLVSPLGFVGLSFVLKINVSRFWVLEKIR